MWDATHTLDEDVMVYEGDPKFCRNVFATLERDGYCCHSFSLAGAPPSPKTRMNEPWHFAWRGTCGPSLRSLHLLSLFGYSMPFA